MSDRPIFYIETNGQVSFYEPSHTDLFQMFRSPPDMCCLNMSDLKQLWQHVVKTAAPWSPSKIKLAEKLWPLMQQKATQLEALEVPEGLRRKANEEAKKAEGPEPLSIYEIEQMEKEKLKKQEMQRIKSAQPILYDELQKKKKGKRKEARKTKGYLVTDKQPVKQDKLPPQAIICLNALREACKEADGPISEERAREVLDELKASGQLHTTQTAWKVFQYYRPNFIALGFIRRHNLESL